MAQQSEEVLQHQIERLPGLGAVSVAMRDRISSVRSGVEALVSRVEIDLRERLVNECSDTPSGEASEVPLAVQSAVADGRLAVTPDCTASFVEVNRLPRVFGVLSEYLRSDLRSRPI